MRIQNLQILDYCRKNNGITSFEAIHNLGIGSLSRRICDLQEMGYKITKVIETGINHHTGQPCHWTRYFIGGLL